MRVCVSVCGLRAACVCVCGVVFLCVLGVLFVCVFGCFVCLRVWFLVFL